jgi:hypothetical protein
MLDSYFTIYNQIILVLSFLILLLSLVHFEFYNNSKSFILLLIGGAGIKLFMILLTPYLFAWDEAFHGLVAKHLSENPLKPLLYKNHIIKHDYKNWWESSIWLHKQPWFLWQMALSIKLLDATYFAVRLPSLIYTIASIFFIYDIGKNIANKRIGFYAAFFYCLNYYMNEQLSGAMATDHNDVVFITLIYATFWSFTKYLINRKLKYVLLIGLFCGLAILTKWLVGLLIFFIWGVYILFETKGKLKLNSFFDFMKSLLLAIFIAAPWQIYILLKFPEESRFEYAFSSKHLHEVIEGHSGSNYFYIDGLSIQYGYLSILFCLMGIVLLHKYISRKNLYYALIITLVFVYLFFTYAATKLHGFTLIVSFFIFLGFGAIINELHSFLGALFKQSGKIILVLIVLTFGFLSFNIEAIQERHTNWKLVEKSLFSMYRESEFKEICDYINQNVKDTNLVIFNCDFPSNISLMFETNNIGYDRMPNESDIQIIKNKGYKIAIINKGILSSEIENNKDYTIITIPKFKVIRRDTCYLYSIKHGYFSIDNNKLTCNSNKSKFIITTFADGYSQIKSENNFLARVAYEYGSLILLDGTKYNFNERFKFESIGNNCFRIKPFQEKYLKTNDDGERVIIDGYEIEKDNYKFKLIKS